MKKRKNKLNNIPAYHIVQQFLNTRFSRKECAITVARLKSNVSLFSMSQALDNLFHSSPHYKDILWGFLFPEDESELGESNYHFVQPDDIWGDLNWLYLQVKKNTDKLTPYFRLRNDIEKDILLGYYDDALIKLEKVRKLMGVSIWYYEIRMLIYSYTDKEKQILELLSDINEKKKNSKHGFVPFLLSFLYKRCSKTHSAYAFDSELENRFNLNRTDFQKARYNYFLFRLNFYLFYHVTDISPILTMEATNSLIDRYNVMVHIIKASFSNNDDENIRRAYSNIALKFYKVTGDSELSSLVAYSHVNILHESYYCQDLIELLDLYYGGKYQDCIKKCKRYIQNNTPKFDVVKIYCKSLSLSQSKYIPITGNINSILNQISKLVFTTMNKTFYDETISALYQINKNIYSLSFAHGLNAFVNDKKKSKSDDVLYYLSLLSFDPAYCGIFTNIEDKQKYLNSVSKWQTFQSIVIEYQKCRNNHDVAGCYDIANFIKDMDLAKIAFINEEYEKSLNLWLDILEKHSTILPITQNAIEYVYKCYFCLDKKQEAISLYVDYYLKGAAYVSRINTDEMEDTLYKEKYKRGVKNGLDLQLFVFLTSSEDERKGCVLERFCAYMEVEDVSSLIPELSFEKNRQKIELYLFMLATEDILRHLIYVDSTKKMLEEQQKIANYLVTLESSQNIETYKTLSQELADTMIVYQNAKKIDESKIFVNQGALLKYDLKEHESLYLQFKKQFSLSASSNSYFIVNTVNPFNVGIQDDSLISTQVRFTNKAFIDSSCQVFRLIREKFLFSKFGMKTYLSTRIRHGVLEGVLRSGLDSLHLVLSTEYNKYVPIEYWTVKYGLRADEHAELMKILENFSKGINYEIEKFKEEVLQIKIEECDKGMFDYRLTADDMCFATVSAETKAKSYEEFCMLLMEYLLHMTNANLIKIRDEINMSLKQKFIGLIDIVSQDIIRFNNNQRLYDELCTTVANARADINQKMVQIEKWFYLQDAKFDDFSLVKQIKIVWNITYKMYPNMDCKIKLNGFENDFIIKSAYFIHVSDILTIFFNNMLSYSNPTPKREFVVSMNMQDDGFMNISFENDIKENEEVLNTKFKEMLKSDSRLMEEGRSGLVKVRKILKYDLGCIENEIDVKAINGKCIAQISINIKDIVV